MSPEPVPGASTASVLTSAAAAAAARAAIEPLTSPTTRPRALDLHHNDGWPPSAAFRKPGADPTTWSGTLSASGTWPRTTTPPFATAAMGMRGAAVPGRTASYPAATRGRGSIPTDWHEQVDWPTSAALGSDPDASFTSTSSYSRPKLDQSWLAARARASWHAVPDDDYYADAAVGDDGSAAQCAELADFAARGGVGGDAGWHANTASASWVHHDLQQHGVTADPRPVPYPSLHAHHHHQLQQHQQQYQFQQQQYQQSPHQQNQYQQNQYQQNAYQPTQFHQHRHLQNLYLHHHHHQLPTSSGPRFGYGAGNYGSGVPTTTSSKPAKVFVSYLPPHYTVDDVARVFGQFGTIVSIKLLPTPNAALLPLKYRCGFVQFDSDLAVQACIQALHQRHVAVAGKRYILTVRDASAQAPMNTTNLMVKNLPASLDEQRLRIEFAKYGPVTSVRIIRDRDRDHVGHQRHHTGGFAGKALGFVNFRHSADATRALHGMHNAYLDGRRLHVSFAEKEYPYNVHVFDHDPLAPAGSAGSGAEDVLELDSFGIPVAPPPTAGEVAAVNEVYPTPEITRVGDGAGSAQIASIMASPTAMAQIARRGASPGAWNESNDAVSPEVQLRRAMLHHVAHRRGTSGSAGAAAGAGSLSLPTVSSSAARTSNPALALPMPDTAASWAGPMSPTWPTPTAAQGPMSPPPSATFQGGVSTSQATSWYPAHDATDLPSAMDRLQLGSDTSVRSADAESMGPHRLLIYNLHASVTDAFLTKSFAEAVACHLDSLTHSASVDFLTKAAGLRAAATLYPTLNPAHLASYLVPIATTTMASPVATLTALPTSTASWTAPPRPIGRFAPSSTTSITTQSSAGSTSGSGAVLAAATMPMMPWEHEADTYFAMPTTSTSTATTSVARSESSSVPTLVGMASPPITPLVDRFGVAVAAGWNAPSSSSSVSVVHTVDEAETVSSACAHALGAPPALMSDLMAVLDRGE
ncbi:hypothetical protein AMAG_13565 [Allomyces macrogynus ATCC 38327]|uniref:RRM domain-containing protein n=1 Tax=Allomyces macrogynus (strain ATCC 38327) TaxID=578462 RepID=A0A0L0T2U3_ALLM3|nr:hypothetical protein, variant [Allomyces macrogynus ATCC 38327]KNE68930.1 hypothetical protein AMAG_13565 [Allomyces macrogynus ATCC 38327]|eukprot:KNE68929.1 hypothetical protein, variant [Allomyces macrogynus ATCC 38327]